MHSAIYSGTLQHRRHRPREHAFSYSVFMVYVDLAELPAVFDAHPLWSARRPALAWFRRADYLGDANTPLDRAVRELIEARLGDTPQGPIRMLTNLRMFGHCINPVTFYYVFDESGTSVTHLVAEVTNTPWGERHAYVARGLDSHHEKALHVSPFNPMDQRYRWHAGLPGERLAVSIALYGDGDGHGDGDERVFDATLQLARREITRPELTRRLLGQAPITLKVAAGIYAQALRLRLKGLRLQPHPGPAGRGAGTAHPAPRA